MKPEWLDRRIAAPGPYLTLCLHKHEFDAVVKRMKLQNAGNWIKTPHSHATMHSFEHESGSLCCVVCLNEWQGREPVEVAGLLVHEAVHIWQGYAERIGEHQPGSEQEAYAIQSIAQELMAEFARRVAECGKIATS